MEKRRYGRKVLGAALAGGAGFLAGRAVGIAPVARDVMKAAWRTRKLAPEVRAKIKPGIVAHITKRMQARGGSAALARRLRWGGRIGAAVGAGVGATVVGRKKAGRS